MPTSAVASNDIEMHIDEDTGHRYSYNTTTGDTEWLEDNEE
jgi:hypothetical protein